MTVTTIIIASFLLLSLSKVTIGLCFLSKSSTYQSCSYLIKFAPTSQRLKKHASILYSSVEDSSIIYNNEDGNLVDKTKSMLRIGYKFSRPHTIKGTILASVMAVTRALIENPTKLSINLVPRALTGLVALLCGNAYIVGINQIYDVKIDEINKPFLPIASKMLSEENAWKLVLSCLIIGVSIVKSTFSPAIFALYMTGVLLGTLYSVPPVQLKRIPIAAGGIIAVVRGFLLNFGVYYAVREALCIPFVWNPVVAFISGFMTIFASVIAVTKDLPDIEGDRKYQISTFASRFGVASIAFSSSCVLAVAYIAAILLPLTPMGSQHFNRLPMMGGHALYLIYFLFSYSRFNPDSMESLKKFYKAIWTLFYLEYCLYPFI
mmetsp:Transcript_24938/g.35814  ORF Transcript_24938/g.35814 Transcript_24938/m.35814 type:complete len:377 (+) Transcript_24938:52-1182(+)